MLVLLFLGHSFIGFPQYSFTGRITDQFENPIVGATISKGIVHQISLTDSSGKYAENFSDSTAAFTFSCAGFISKTQKCSSGQFTFIILERNITLLDETIIQAFERNVGVTSIAASVSVISKTIIDRFPSQSFVTAFNTIPGVKMDERSPGSYRLNIRGNLLRSTHKTVDPAVPTRTGVGQPRQQGRQWFRARRVVNLAAGSAGSGQAGFHQRLQVLDDRLAADRHGGVGHQLRGGLRSVAQEAIEQRPTGRITERREQFVEHARGGSGRSA